MNITDNNFRQNFWQDYTNSLINNDKDAEESAEAYTKVLDDLNALAPTGTEGAVALSQDLKDFFEAENLELPDYDGDPDQLNSQELSDIKLGMVDLNEQVSLSNAILESMQNQVVREIAGTMSERRNFFEEDNSYI